MARSPQDRENLMRDATGLNPRASWIIPSFRQEIITGVRSPGAVSLYFGDDPVFHFNSQGELRRMFLADDLWKAERGKLIRLKRERSLEATTLHAREETEVNQREILQVIQTQLVAFRTALTSGVFQCTQAIPDSADSAEFWLQQLKTIRDPLEIAMRPHTC